VAPTPSATWQESVKGYLIPLLLLLVLQAPKQVVADIILLPLMLLLLHKLPCLLLDMRHASSTRSPRTAVCIAGSP
jgi:hypothetical protein